MKPLTHTYSKELGSKFRVSGIEESVRRIVDAYPNAMGEFVAGSNELHRTYWNQGKRIAHTWIADNAVWMRIKL